MAVLLEWVVLVHRGRPRRALNTPASVHRRKYDAPARSHSLAVADAGFCRTRGATNARLGKAAAGRGPQSRRAPPGPDADTGSRGGGPEKVQGGKRPVLRPGLGASRRDCRRGHRLLSPVREEGKCLVCSDQRPRAETCSNREQPGPLGHRIVLRQAAADRAAGYSAKLLENADPHLRTGAVCLRVRGPKLPRNRCRCWSAKYMTDVCKKVYGLRASPLAEQPGGKTFTVSEPFGLRLRISTPTSRTSSRRWQVNGGMQPGKRAIRAGARWGHARQVGGVAVIDYPRQQINYHTRAKEVHSFLRGPMLGRVGGGWERGGGVRGGGERAAGSQ